VYKIILDVERHDHSSISSIKGMQEEFVYIREEM
jgi:hypothetical protein